MIRPASLAVALCSLASSAALATTDNAQPQRVVSLDYCADQYVLKLVAKARILAVSPDAVEHFSYMRGSAAGVAQVRPRAEDVLSLQPDLVVRSYGGGPRAVRFFERAGVDVLQVPYAGDFDGIRDTVTFMAEGLGAPQRGAQIVAEMDRRLGAMRRQHHEKQALYMTPTGVTSGPGTLVHEMLLAAGMENFQQREGWRSIPLERLAYEGPDIVVAAFFSTQLNNRNHWSAMRHPVAKRQINERPSVMLEGAWTSCGGWFLLDAVEAIASAGAGTTAP